MARLRRRRGTSTIWRACGLLDPMLSVLRFVSLARLGASRATEGWLAKAAVVATVALALVLAVGMVVLAGDSGARRDVSRWPLAAASIQVWGGGVLVAISASSQALVRDAREGVSDMVARCGSSLNAYLLGRVAGLALVLGVLASGGTLLVSFFLVLASGSGAGPILHATLAALGGAVAFSVTIAPLALAALGARSRLGGYLVLVLVLALPELLASLVARHLPSGWEELLSVPAAVSAVSDALAPGTVDAPRALRACCVLAAFAIGALIAARGQVARARRVVA